jgi:hypothetical protein
VSDRAIAIGLAVLAGACSSPADRAPDETVLRVSALHGLGEFVPSADMAGSTAYALGLVYRHLGEHAEIVSRKDAVVRLRPRSSSPFQAVELKELLVYKGLERVEQDGGDLVATFEAAAAAAGFARGAYPCLALGPYELAEKRRTAAGEIEQISLRARPGSGRRIDVIELVTVPEGEQWRRLMARDIGVIPALPGADRAEFEGLHTVRLVDHRTSQRPALFFNVEHERLRSAATRRGLAALVDTAAVAEVVCGGDYCRPLSSTVALIDDIELPRSLSVLALETDSSILLAARALRHQLYDAGVALEIEALPLRALMERFHGRRFELFLMPSASDFESAFVSDDIKNVSGYTNPDYDAAIAAGDLDRAREILADDPPAVVLYEIQSFAAIDERFCGGEPELDYDWSWLADLYPCDEEARP